MQETEYQQRAEYKRRRQIKVPDDMDEPGVGWGGTTILVTSREDLNR
jgi:hypothetical protein